MLYTVVQNPPVCLKLNFIVKVHQFAVLNCVVSIMLCIVFRLAHAATYCPANKLLAYQQTIHQYTINVLFLHATYECNDA